MLSHWYIFVIRVNIVFFSATEIPRVTIVLFIPYDVVNKKVTPAGMFFVKFVFRDVWAAKYVSGRVDICC